MAPLIANPTIFFLAFATAELNISSGNSGPPPYEVGSQLILTCELANSNLSVARWDWITVCSSGVECFSSTATEQVISTESRVLVPVLTSVDNGLYKCTANLSNGTLFEANSFEVNVTGTFIMH